MITIVQILLVSVIITITIIVVFVALQAIQVLRDAKLVLKKISRVLELEYPQSKNPSHPKPSSPVKRFFKRGSR